MKTWLLSELFYPEETSTGYFMTKIAESLGKKIPDGIHVICGPEHYESSQLRSQNELDRAIKVYRVSIPNLNKNSFFQRTLRMLLLSLKMSFKLLMNSKRHDKVFIVTNPAPLLVLVALVKKIKNFELLIIVHDVFPENMLPGGIIKSTSFSFKIIRRVFNYAYRQADRIISVGEDMNELMIEKTNFYPHQTTVIRNWADCDQIYPLDITPQFISEYYGYPELSGKIVIQFAGNIGRLQGLSEFLQLFHEANNELLAFVLIGSGALKHTLEESIIKAGIKNVYFISPKSRAEQNQFLNASHIGLVSLNSGMYGLGVPSKTYNIWAAGKPVLFLGDRQAEIARNISKFNTGWAFAWEMRKDIISFLKGLNTESLEEIKHKGNSGRKSAVEYFDRKVILAEYENV